MLLALVVVEGVLAMRCAAEEQRCSNCIVTVPWSVVPQLVARRGVVLARGQCQVPCHLSHQLLAELFTLLLRCGLRHLATHRQLERLAGETPHLHASLKRCVREFLLHHQLQPFLRSGCGSILPPMAAKAVPSAALLFPPCMLQLQRLLQRHRRLQHHQRYRYTVFLKGVGMPLDQNIAYWQDHYSCSAHHHATCEHSWPRHGARYIYSLRHAYGLEGRRLPATPHSCQQLQNLTPQPGDCGGCPFAAVAEGAPREETALEEDIVDGHSTASVFSEREKSLFHGNSTTSSERCVKDVRKRIADEKPPEEGNSHDEPKNVIRSNRSQKSPQLGENSVRARTLVRCNSFSMISSSDILSSSQSVLMDISNNLPNKVCFNTGRALSRTKSYSVSRLTASSHKKTSPSSILNSERISVMRPSSTRLPGESTTPYASSAQSFSILSPIPSSVSLPTSSTAACSPSQSSNSVLANSSVTTSSTQRSPTTSSTSTTHLRHLLRVYGLPPCSTEEIIRAAHQGQPSLACRMTLARMLEAAEDAGKHLVGKVAGIDSMVMKPAKDRVGIEAAKGGMTSLVGTNKKVSESANRNGMISGGQNIDVTGDGATSKNAEKVEAKRCNLYTNNQDHLNHLTSHVSMSKCADSTWKAASKSCPEIQGVVVTQDIINETSTSSPSGPKCNTFSIESKNTNAEKLTVNSVQISSSNHGNIKSMKLFKTDTCCLVTTPSSSSIHTLYTSSKQNKSVDDGCTRKVYASSALTTRDEATQNSLKRRAVINLPNNLTNKDKVRKLLVRTKSFCVPLRKVVASKKGNVFDGRCVVGLTTEGHQMESSDKCLQIVNEAKTVSGGGGDPKKIENSRSDVFDKLTILSNLSGDGPSAGDTETENDCQIVYDSCCNPPTDKFCAKVSPLSHRQVEMESESSPEMIYNYSSKHSMRHEQPPIKDNPNLSHIDGQFKGQVAVNPGRFGGTVTNQVNMKKNLFELDRKDKFAIQQQTNPFGNGTHATLPRNPDILPPRTEVTDEKNFTTNAISFDFSHVTGSSAYLSNVSSVSCRANSNMVFAGMHAAKNKNIYKFIPKNAPASSTPKVDPSIFRVTATESSDANVKNIPSEILGCNTYSCSEQRRFNTAEVILPAITAVSDSLCVGMALRTGPYDNIVTGSASRKGLVTNPCGTPITAILPSNGLSAEPCGKLAVIITSNNDPITESCVTPTVAITSNNRPSTEPCGSPTVAITSNNSPSTEPSGTPTVAITSNSSRKNGPFGTVFAAIAENNDPSTEPCGTTVVPKATSSVARDVLRGAHLELCRTWGQKAVDPADASLSFVSPVQFYSLFVGLSSQDIVSGSSCQTPSTSNTA